MPFSGSFAPTSAFALPTVLLIEDDPLFAELVEGFLEAGAGSGLAGEAAGFRVLRAATLEQGLAVLSGVVNGADDTAPVSGGADVVLLDLSLGDSDGLATLDAVIGHAPGVPVVVLTGDASERMALQAVRKGAQDYLVKADVRPVSLRRALLYALERRSTLTALLQAGSAVSGLLDSLNAAAAVIEAHRDSSGTVTGFVWCLGNGGCQRLLGLDVAAVEGRPLTDTLPWYGDSGLPAALARVADGYGDLDRELEVTIAGQTCWLHVSAVRLAGGRLDSGRLAVTLEDITERYQHQERLRFLATRDPLTGLPNRTLFQDHLEEAVSRAERGSQRAAVLYIDLDHFKTINDTMGHSTGDRVLQDVARRLEALSPPDAFISHLSGDEFAVLLPRVSDEAEVTAAASSVLKHLELPFVIDGREIFTSGSIGVVLYPDSARNSNGLMRNVDAAVHHAKRQGRNTYSVYSEHLSHEMVRRLHLETGLRRALERGEMRVVFQPKMDLATGTVSGAEALLRWDSPDLGAVSPAEFIPVAEDSGLIIPIGEWVLEEVCRWLARWNRQGRKPVRVAVNLSARQFRDPLLVDRVKAIVAAAGVPARQLEFELTESVLVENAAEATKALWALRGLGVTLSVDDFGTGYSSLSYLKRFPIDALKIDQSFVRDLPDSSDDKAIVRAIILMGRSLDLALVAEGVETQAQADFLQANRCDYAQGYLFARPISGADFEDFVSGCDTELELDVV
ncbi:putative bifunctional diguanylate cyclase/phosphodiesterase [Novispirillum itersonii]|uniref:putative bifunctional diguanylate cyclase/phosphodiesterase n=1 Tax=Novispirillum itersonii TaxID=189 RepID=UPI000380C53E|nr:EAL domain-containing protein [Novispirillum itersonii]